MTEFSLALGVGECFWVTDQPLFLGNLASSHNEQVLGPHPRMRATRGAGTGSDVEWVIRYHDLRLQRDYGEF
jgi:hypothetical protein